MRQKVYCTYCSFKLDDDLYCSECGQTSKYLFECDSLVLEIDRLKQDIQQHIKWNEAHTKARVELTEEVERLREELDSANECSTVLYSEVERLKQENEELKKDLASWNNEHY